MVKIKRSFPAPESLAEESKKVSRRYDKPDVIARLKEDFHNKCYICEMKDLQDPNVEHLYPHKNGKYRRENLTGKTRFGHADIVTVLKTIANMMRGFWIAAGRTRKNICIFRLRMMS